MQPLKQLSRLTGEPSPIDLFESHSEEYVALPSPRLVETRPAHYLTLYGSGEPGADSFGPRFAALYSVAYGLKRLCVRNGQDFKIAMPEGLFWGSDAEGRFLVEPPTRWLWMLCVRVPSFVTPEMIREVAAEVQPQKPELLIDEIRLKCLNEGACIQTLHVGKYADEVRSVETMVRFAEDHGLVPRGPHHEIYLDDPATVGEDRARTILRQPVKPRAAIRAVTTPSGRA